MCDSRVDAIQCRRVKRLFGRGARIQFIDSTMIDGMVAKCLLMTAFLGSCVACIGCSDSSAPASTAKPALRQRDTAATTTPEPLAGDKPVKAQLASATVEDAPSPLDLPDDPNAVVDATFDHLKFDIEPDAAFDETMLTPTINKLFERNIRIRGYIYPTLKKRGLKQFVLVRDNQECCFGPGAALFDCILVHMKEGKTAEYSIRPVAVEGKFSFEIFPDYDGTTRAIYRLDGESVE